MPQSNIALLPECALEVKAIGTTAIGQAPQALTYVPDAVPSGDGTQNLEPLGLAGQATHLTMAAAGAEKGAAPTTVTLFNQGLIQVLQAATLVAVFVAVTSQLLSDVAYRYLNPRMRFAETQHEKPLKKALREFLAEEL